MVDPHDLLGSSASPVPTVTGAEAVTADTHAPLPCNDNVAARVHALPATPAPAISADEANDVAAREHAFPLGSTPPATLAPVISVGAALEDTLLEDDLAPGSCEIVAASHALARLMLVVEDSPEASATTVDGTLPMLAATPAAAMTTTPRISPLAPAATPTAATTTEAMASTGAASTISRKAATMAALVPSFEQVYTRRHKQSRAASCLVSDATPTENSNSPARSQWKGFMATVTKKTVKLLPTPRANRLRSRARAPDAPPRRSRRIARMESAAPGSGAKSRTKKKVMRALNIIGETAGID